MESSFLLKKCKEIEGKRARTTTKNTKTSFIFQANIKALAIGIIRAEQVFANQIGTIVFLSAVTEIEIQFCEQ